MHPSDEEDFVDEYYNDQDPQFNLFHSYESSDYSNKNKGRSLFK